MFPSYSGLKLMVLTPLVSFLQPLHSTVSAPLFPLPELA